jgi:hypothetical protein
MIMTENGLWTLSRLAAAAAASEADKRASLSREPPGHRDGEISWRSHVSLSEVRSGTLLSGPTRKSRTMRVSESHRYKAARLRVAGAASKASLYLNLATLGEYSTLARRSTGSRSTDTDWHILSECALSPMPVT